MVEIGGARVHLTEKEYQMLELLALRKGTTLNKEMFLSHLYGGADEPDMKIIDVFVCKLRKKLASASGGKLTSRRSGGAAILCLNKPTLLRRFRPDNSLTRTAATRAGKSATGRPRNRLR
jgi:hypothetical protein